MKNITIHIACDNAAFEDFPEVELARILQGITHQLRDGEKPKSLYDINGNKVGEIIYEE